MKDLTLQSKKCPTLFALALGVAESKTHQIGEESTAVITHLYIDLPDSGSRLSTGKGCWDIKPLVKAVDGSLELGEIAVLRALEADGWEGVWVCTFGGLKFWRSSMQGSPTTLPKGSAALFNRICEARGGTPAGFFDLMSWRDGHFLFVEYKGKGDSSNSDEKLWISAARQAGVRDDQLVIVHGHIPLHFDRARLNSHF